MKINRVTITGADDNVSPQDLVDLSAEFPFVEWAILLAEGREGPKYPTLSWVEEFVSLSKIHNLNLAGHICSAWIRDLVIKKNPSVFIEHPEFIDYFPRIQLNFSPYNAAQLFLDVLKPFKNEFIFQIGNHGKKDKISLLNLGRSKGLNLSVLFDRSGGKGVVPDTWDEPIDPFYLGYAGGLGPDSLEEELPKIAEVVGDRTIWVDMESKIRSEDNEFNLKKVRTSLEILKPWVF